MKEVVELLTKAEGTEMLTDPRTAVDYSVILQKESTKNAAEYVTLQVLEKSTSELRMMVEETDEDFARS